MNFPYAVLGFFIACFFIRENVTPSYPAFLLGFLAALMFDVYRVWRKWK